MNVSPKDAEFDAVTDSGRAMDTQSMTSAPTTPAAMRYNRSSEDAVKSSTKGFLIGFVSGIALTVILVVGGFVALMLSVQAMMDEGTGTAMMMPAPHLPAVDRLTVYGQADYAWKLSTLDGEAVALESYRGKTVLLNHWATWCGPCVAEMPSLAALHDSIDRDDVAIVRVYGGRRHGALVLRPEGIQPSGLRGRGPARRVREPRHSRHVHLRFRGDDRLLPHRRRELG